MLSQHLDLLVVILLYRDFLPLSCFDHPLIPLNSFSMLILNNRQPVLPFFVFLHYLQAASLAQFIDVL